MPIDPTSIVPLTRTSTLLAAQRPDPHLDSCCPMQVYSMGVGRASIKITHGRLSSRHFCQLPPPALEGAWVKVEEIIGRGGAATRRSKSLLFIRAHHYADPKPHAIRPEKREYDIPARDRRPAPPNAPHRADLTILESEMLLRTLVPGGPYHSVCAAQPQSCMKESART
eukprot:scaffold11249_cov85-Phaeocystis_antarctica.AAC.1